MIWSVQSSYQERSSLSVEIDDQIEGFETLSEKHHEVLDHGVELSSNDVEGSDREFLLGLRESG